MLPCTILTKTVPVVILTFFPQDMAGKVTLWHIIPDNSVHDYRIKTKANHK